MPTWWIFDLHKNGQCGVHTVSRHDNYRNTLCYDGWHYLGSCTEECYWLVWLAVIFTTFSFLDGNHFSAKPIIRSFFREPLWCTQIGTAHGWNQVNTLQYATDILCLARAWTCQHRNVHVVSRNVTSCHMTSVGVYVWDYPCDYHWGWGPANSHHFLLRRVCQLNCHLSRKRSDTAWNGWAQPVFLQQISCWHNQCLI